MILNKKNKFLFLIFLFLILIKISLISLVFGPVKMSVYQIINIISHKIFFFINDANPSFEIIHESVLWNIRIPRILMGVLVGLGLGSSGAILQGLFRNPLVDPGFIGVSSGAAVGAMIAIMFTSAIEIYFHNSIKSFILPFLAITGSFITTMTIYKMSRIANKTNIMAMLLSGIAINALAGAVIGLFVSISSDSELRSFTFWTLGGLDNSSWEIIGISSLFIFVPFFWTK